MSLKKMACAGISGSLVIAALLSGCSGINSSSSSSKEPIKIGMVEPLSGGSAYDGQNIVAGGKLAAEKINAAGGILGGRQIVIVTEDSASQPAQAVSAAQKLVSKENIVALLGALNSSSTEAMEAVAEKAGVPFLNGTSTSPTLINQGSKFFFHMNGDSQMFADSFAKKIMNEMGVKKVAFIYENGDWGRNSVKAFANAVTANGGTALEPVVINEGDQDLYSHLTKIKDQNPDAIYAVANTANAARITNTAKEMGLLSKMKIFGEGAWTNQKYLELTKQNSDGIYAVVEYLDTVNNPVNQKFVADYKAKYGNLPDKNAAAGYRKVISIAQAIEKAGSTDGVKIREAIHGMTFDTVTGQYTFDDKGQAHGFNMFLAKISNAIPEIVMTTIIQ